MEKTKLKLDSYYSFRTSAPEFYKDRYPFSTAINDILKSSSFMILDESTESAKPALCLLQFDMWKYENCTLIDAIKFWLMILDVFFKEHDNMVVSGVNVILDYSHFQHYALQCTPMLIKKVVLLMQKAYPIRIEGVYIVNAPTIFESFYSIAKIFMSRKLKSRIYFYSLDDLYDKFQKRMLPKEYGGENSTIEKLAAYVNKKVESSKIFFLNDEKYGSNEALRPVNTTCPEDMLGIEGSFRRLTID